MAGAPAPATSLFNTNTPSFKAAASTSFAPSEAEPGEKSRPTSPGNDSSPGGGESFSEKSSMKKRSRVGGSMFSKFDANGNSVGGEDSLVEKSVRALKRRGTQVLSMFVPPRMTEEQRRKMVEKAVRAQGNEARKAAEVSAMVGEATADAMRSASEAQAAGQPAKKVKHPSAIKAMEKQGVARAEPTKGRGILGWLRSLLPGKQRADVSL